MNMNTLSRIPFWLWLLILTALCYAVWNPSGLSVYHMLIGEGTASSTKLLITVLMFIIFGIFSNATYRALGKWGLTLYLILVGSVLYFLYDHDILNKENAGNLKYIAPFIVALLLAIGSQGAKIYRAITGRVTVEDRDTVHPDEHVHGADEEH
jgi:hypothetical protein